MLFTTANIQNTKNRHFTWISYPMAHSYIDPNSKLWFGTMLPKYAFFHISTNSNIEPLSFTLKDVQTLYCTKVMLFTEGQ